MIVFPLLLAVSSAFVQPRPCTLDADDDAVLQAWIANQGEPFVVSRETSPMDTDLAERRQRGIAVYYLLPVQFRLK